MSWEISDFKTERLATLLTTGMLLLCGTTPATCQSAYPPLMRSNFAMVAPQGFGDRQNGWAWSMAWFQGNLYVGTNRAWRCVEAESLHLLAPKYQPYPPTDPAISCTPDPNDLPLQAEIWMWSPSSNTWTRVFQSPQDIPIPGTNKFVARDIGFRGMLVYTEADGTKALYVSGFSSKTIHFSVPGARILRSVDGVNFTPIPQDPGTFLGNVGNAGFRGGEEHNGKFYTVAGSIRGPGVLLESADPKSGNNSFQQVSPQGMQIFELASYNGFLYVTVSATTGFSVMKTNATGPPPYTFTPVFTNGGYRPTLPNQDGLSLKEFNGRLYVGGDGMQSSFGAELFRVNPDDSWDLISGYSRNTPAGQKNSLSGLGPGFSWFLNAHMWRMEVFDARLYVGTFDLSTVFRTINNAQLQQIMLPEFGFDLWQTSDGVYYFQVDQQGFQDKFNFGVRTLQTTPFGLFLGTANYYYGLQVWQGVPAVAPGTNGAVLAAPQAVQVESSGARALLSWDAPSGGAGSYQILRSTLIPTTSVALGVSNVQNDGTLADTGSPAVPVYIPDPFQVIGKTQNAYFEDSAVNPALGYMYAVQASDGHGGTSGLSNLAQLPSAAPPMTFAEIAQHLERAEASGRFLSHSAQQQVLNALQAARAAATHSDFSQLLAFRNWIRTSGRTAMKAFAAEDLDLLLSKLVNRAQLVKAGLISVGAL